MFQLLMKSILLKTKDEEPKRLLFHRHATNFKTLFPERCEVKNVASSQEGIFFNTRIVDIRIKEASLDMWQHHHPVAVFLLA